MSIKQCNPGRLHGGDARKEGCEEAIPDPFSNVVRALVCEKQGELQAWGAPWLITIASVVAVGEKPHMGWAIGYGKGSVPLWLKKRFLGHIYAAGSLDLGGVCLQTGELRCVVSLCGSYRGELIELLAMLQTASGTVYYDMRVSC